MIPITLSQVSFSTKNRISENRSNAIAAHRVTARDHHAAENRTADAVETAVETKVLYEQAVEFGATQERVRLARELHDSVTQSLYSLTLMAAGWQRMAKGGAELDVVDLLSEIGELGQQALKEARLLIYELRPPDLENEGLVGALQKRLSAVERRAGMQAQITADTDIPMTREQEEELYWIAQGALSNSLKHSSANEVTIRLSLASQTSTVDVGGQRASGQRASGQRASGQRVSGQKVDTRRTGHIVHRDATVADRDRLPPGLGKADTPSVWVHLSPGQIVPVLAQPVLPLPALSHFCPLYPDFRSPTKSLHSRFQMPSSGCLEDYESPHQKNTSRPVAVLEIADNGIGFDQASITENNSAGLGLSTMQERAAKLNGSFAIESSAGHGTLVRVIVPM